MPEHEHNLSVYYYIIIIVDEKIEEEKEYEKIGDYNMNMCT